MGRLSRIVSGRRSVWAVLAVWLVAVGAFGAPAGKFESAQKNDAASFLPGSAESVQVLDAAKRFRSGDATVASVVYRDPAGLTAADRRAIAAVSEHVDAAGLRGVVRPAPPVYSRDGSAALVTVPILANNDIDRITAAVDEIRSVIDRTGPPTLEAHVTGPAGFSADAAKVFQGINSTLLYATALLVFFLLVLIYRSPIFWFLPLLSVLFAESVVRGLGYLLAQAGVVINGQVGGLLLVLVFGAGTDYALLLTARYREELRLVEDKHAAMRIAVRQAGPAIVASAGTVVAALLCLSFARAEHHGGAGPGWGNGRRRGGYGHADPPPRAPRPWRAAGVLAVRAALRVGGGVAPRRVAAPGRAHRASPPRRLDHHRAGPRGHGARSLLAG